MSENIECLNETKWLLVIPTRQVLVASRRVTLVTQRDIITQSVSTVTKLAVMSTISRSLHTQHYECKSFFGITYM